MCVVPSPGTAVPLLLSCSLAVPSVEHPNADLNAGASWLLLVVAVELPVSAGTPVTRFLTRFRLGLAWTAPSAGGSETGTDIRGCPWSHRRAHSPAVVPWRKSSGE